MVSSEVPALPRMGNSDDQPAAPVYGSTVGRYDRVSAQTGLVVPTGKNDADSVQQALAASYDTDPLARRLAAKNLCPCHVRSNRAEVWERLIELANDPDPGVRSDALHALTDGAPKPYWPRIATVLNDRRRDDNPKIRRMAKRLLARQRSSGTFNVG